ncbi:MAG: hypothetical protein KatS3mg131_3877 [Candidatus Tectimicrobiota bacterium]|nr:MAG: hypothetical protein KatS3mg131_3877 [Candidatus Tectomicrobia bacterium]
MTEHQTAEQQHAGRAEQPEPFYRFLLEQAGEAMVVLQQGRAVYWNPAYAELLRCPASVLRHLDPLACVVPEARPRVHEYWQQRLRGEAGPPPCEAALQTPDGRRLALELRLYPCRVQGEAAMLLVLRDVTAYRRTLEALQAAKEYTENLIHSSLDIIVSVDRQRRITEFNRAAEQAFGYGKAEVLGKPVDLLYADAATAARIGEELARGGRFCGEVRNRRKDGSTFVSYLSASLLRDRQGRVVGVMGIARDITAQKEAEAALSQAHQQMAQLLAAIPSILIGLDAELRVTWWNAAAEQTFNLPAAAVVGKPLAACPLAWDGERLAQALARCGRTRQPVRVDDVRFRRPDGKEGFLGITLTPMAGSGGESLGLLLLGADITERKLLQSQLAQAQKLEAIGQLAAGIAHEINTPTQYVGDNLRFLRDAFADLLTLLDAYQESGCGERQQELEALAARLDLPYLRQEIPVALEQALDGVERVATIVRAMKDFSHPGVEEKTPIDLNKALESTVTVARNEWKYVAELVLDLDPDLPLVPCLPGELNQVFLNIVVNAAHAIADVVGDGSQGKGTIRVSTHRDGDWVEVRISDTGTGIPEAIRERIFDPFFTTKEVGKGTGQGLAIAHDVVVKKHGGHLTFETEVGKGTTFIVRLPVGETT